MLSRPFARQIDRPRAFAARASQLPPVAEPSVSARPSARLDLVRENGDRHVLRKCAAHRAGRSKIRARRARLHSLAAFVGRKHLAEQRVEPGAFRSCDRTNKRRESSSFVRTVASYPASGGGGSSRVVFLPGDKSPPEKAKFPCADSENSDSNHRTCEGGFCQLRRDFSPRQ